MVGITPPVENAYSVKRATNLLGIPFSQHKCDSSEPAGKEENGDSLVRKSAFTSKIENHKIKSKITRKQTCFLLFDALAFVPNSLKYLAFQRSLKISVVFIGTFTILQKQPQHKGRGGEKKDEENLRKILPKHIKSFSIFPQSYPFTGISMQL